MLKRNCLLILLIQSALSGSCSAQSPRPEHDEKTLPPVTDEATASAQSPQRMISVPAGRYPIGSDEAPNERPRHQVDLASFRIDAIEVTNADFAKYLNTLNLPVRGSSNAGGLTAEHGNAETIRLLSTSWDGRSSPIIELDDSDAWINLVDGRFQAAPGRERHPATEVTWSGARAYCLWRGGDLPSEAQWEAAARGTDGRRYPWGNARPDSDRAVSGRRFGETAMVGSLIKGASPFGLLDMAGNLAEWTKSLKKPYPYVANDGRENIGASGERTTRGGDYLEDNRPANFSVSFRDGISNDPKHGHRHIGFRCVALAQ